MCQTDRRMCKFTTQYSLAFTQNVPFPSFKQHSLSFSCSLFNPLAALKFDLFIVLDPEERTHAPLCKNP